MNVQPGERPCGTRALLKKGSLRVAETIEGGLLLGAQLRRSLAPLSGGPDRFWQKGLVEHAGWSERGGEVTAASG